MQPYLLSRLIILFYHVLWGYRFEHDAIDFRKRGSSCTAGDIPLGIMKEVTYHDFQLQLNPGDKFILFSDGLTEMMNANSEIFTVRRVDDLTLVGFELK